MEVCRNVYIDESINKNGVNKSLKKIRANKPDLNLYLICVMQNTGCVMEIFHYSECCKPHYKSRRYLVIGIASDKNGALDVVSKIVQDCIISKTELNSNEIYKFFSDTKNNIKEVRHENF